MATMSKAASLALIAMSLSTFLLANHVCAEPSPTPVFDYQFCRNADFGNFTTNSRYEVNLVTALTALKGQASSETFYNTSAGSGNNKVYAQYYCRGDISSTLCSSCVMEATLFALNCSNAKAAIIWYEQCTLRYKNESMYGVTDQRAILYSRLLTNLTDPADFTPVLNETVSSLIQEVAFGNSSSLGQRYYATKDVMMSAFKTVYFLAQCSPDLDNTQCESCLTAAYNTTRTCCGEWPNYLYSFPPSCQLMYNTQDVFYVDPNAPPPPPLSSSSPPPPPPQVIVSLPPPQVIVSPPPPLTQNTGGSTMIRSNESMKLGIMTIALVLIVLVFNI